MGRGTRRWVITIVTFVLITRTILLLSQQGMAWGRSLTAPTLLTLFSILVLSIGLAAWPILVWFKDRRRSIEFTWIAGVAVFALSFGINFLLTEAANHDFEIKKSVYKDQIEYYCLKQFHMQKCTVLINSCTTCVVEIEKWKRNKMAEKLQPFSTQK